MTKPPHIAVVANLFHPQTGEECIIQPVVFQKLPEPPFTAIFIPGL